MRKPTGAAEALLGYVPFTDDDFGREEIQNALNAVAYTDGKPDKAILPFLTDKSAYRRAAAAVALCQGSLGDNLDAVRKLLKDEDANVRMPQAALLLASAPAAPRGRPRADRAGAGSCRKSKVIAPSKSTWRAWPATRNRLACPKATLAGPNAASRGRPGGRTTAKRWRS